MLLLLYIIIIHKKPQKTQNCGKCYLTNIVIFVVKNSKQHN